MGQAERTTFKDAARWACWQAKKTGETYAVYKIDPVSEVRGLAALRNLRTRWIIQPERLPAPKNCCPGLYTVARSDIREKDPTAPKDAS